MKTFKQYLREQKESEAPQGVIFKGDKVAFVGKHHGKPIKLGNQILDKITSIGDQYGYWYEGNGGDVSSSRPLPSDKKDYEGSWDDEMRKSIKGYPSDFLYVLFANPEVNNQKDWMTNPSMTIFDSLMKNNKRMYFKDRAFDSDTAIKFLRDCSQKDTDFLEMSKQMATKENVAKFIDTGDKLMWPDNWDEYPNNAGKVAHRANQIRDKFLFSRESGVYVTGAGHLKDVVKLSDSLKITGGEKIG